MKRSMMHSSLPLAATVALALTSGSAVQAQQPAATPPASTVIKGKAPIAKDVLRVKLPKPKEYKLPNGARLFVLEDHEMPTVSMSVEVRAGDLFSQKRGVADLTAALLTEGTRSRPYEKLSAEVEGLGADLDASAGAERASISASGLSEDTDRLIDLLADVILNPTFAQERLAQAQFRTIAGLSQQKANPGFLASEFSRKLFYGESTPYGRPTPTAEQIKAITPDDLRAFHAQYYRPNGALISVAGDVKADQIAQKLQRALENWKPAAGTEPTLPATNPEPKAQTRIYIIDRPGAAQTVLSFGNIAIKRTDPDYIPLQVANFILGGAFNSRLNQKLREEKGYTYGANSGVNAPKWVGTWDAGASVRTEVTAPAVQAFFEEFAKFQQQPVTADELDQAKRAIVGRFALALESPSAVLGRYVSTVDYGLPGDYWDTYPAKVEAVTAADIQRVSKKYLGEGRIQLIAVGERAKIEPGLAALGSVVVYDPETGKETPVAAPSGG